MLATSPLSTRPDKMIEDLTRSLYQYNYIGLNSFSFIHVRNTERFVKDFVLRSFYSSWSPLYYVHKNRDGWMKYSLHSSEDRMILNIKELSSLIHFPNSKFNRNPRLRWQNFKIVPAPDNIPSE